MSQANQHEPAPTGQGAVVLAYVDDLLQRLVALPVAPVPYRVENLEKLRRDLVARAETGKQKYGTYLRVHNGRNAVVDLYQEILDAAMYCAQARMEGDDDAGRWLETLVNIGQALAMRIKE